MKDMHETKKTENSSPLVSKVHEKGEGDLDGLAFGHNPDATN